MTALTALIPAREPDWRPNQTILSLTCAVNREALLAHLGELNTLLTLGALLYRMVSVGLGKHGKRFCTQLHGSLGTRLLVRNGHRSVAGLALSWTQSTSITSGTIRATSKRRRIQGLGRAFCCSTLSLSSMWSGCPRLEY
jgi:hypothetical protein